MNIKNPYFENKIQKQEIYEQNQKSYFNNEFQTIYSKLYSQIYHLQNLIMAQLFINKNLIDHFQKLNLEIDSKNITSGGSTTSKTIQPEGNFQNSDQLKKQINNRDQIIKKQQAQNPIKKYRINKKNKQKDSSSSYFPSEQQGNERLLNIKSSQTKNIPKNFGSSITNFIKKHPQTVKRLLKQEEKDQQQFNKILQQFSFKLSSIADLRSFWSQQQNPFAKVCRILSMIYLRKHSLNHIFNSRIENYGRHIKYRYKIIEGVKNPSNFSQMKDF